MTQDLWIMFLWSFKNPHKVLKTHLDQFSYFPLGLTWTEKWRHWERCIILNCPLFLRPHSHWFCLGVCGWGWGRSREQRLKCGKSAATRSSCRADTSCIGRSHLTELRTSVSSERSGTDRGGTVGTRSLFIWKFVRKRFTLLILQRKYVVLARKNI